MCHAEEHCIINSYVDWIVLHVSNHYIWTNFNLFSSFTKFKIWHTFAFVRKKVLHYFSPFFLQLKWQVCCHMGPRDKYCVSGADMYPRFARKEYCPQPSICSRTRVITLRYLPKSVYIPIWPLFIRRHLKRLSYLPATSSVTFRKLSWYSCGGLFYILLKLPSSPLDINHTISPHRWTVKMSKKCPTNPSLRWRCLTGPLTSMSKGASFS